MMRAQDWLEQAKLDLRHARNARDDQDYNWSCFAAQQAAEKALKALYLSRHLEGWGHSVKHLLEEMKEELEISEELLAAGKKLDQYYILTRYPNGFAAGKPADYYTDQDACEAIGHAEKIIEFCEGEIRSA